MDKRKYLAIAVLRIGIGFLFVFHGFPKLMGGINTWTWLGTNAGFSSFFPGFWGFLAMVTELFGGFMLILGLKTRIVSLFLGLTMIFAMVHHINSNDGFVHYSHALKAFLVFVTLFISGSGPYSLDAKFFKKK